MGISRQDKIFLEFVYSLGHLHDLLVGRMEGRKKGKKEWKRGRKEWKGGRKRDGRIGRIGRKDWKE